jgi:hypothetical protein
LDEATEVDRARAKEIATAPSTMDGVKVFIVTPDEIPVENRY